MSLRFSASLRLCVRGFGLGFRICLRHLLRRRFAIRSRLVVRADRPHPHLRPARQLLQRHASQTPSGDASSSRPPRRTFRRNVPTLASSVLFPSRELHQFRAVGPTGSCNCESNWPRSFLAPEVANGTFAGKLQVRPFDGDRCGLSANIEEADGFWRRLRDPWHIRVCRRLWRSTGPVCRAGPD